MDWEFILYHLISGCIPLAVALAFYYIILHVMGKRQTSAHILISFVFCFFLLGILTMTGVCFRGTFSPNIVFIPFVGMIRGPKDTVQNVLLFIPLGFFLPLLYERFGRLRKVAVIGFLVSLSVEIAQMFGTGTSDINDLITNTFGTCLGYGIFSLLYRTIPKSWNEKIRVKGTQGYYESILFWVGSLLIMITIQILIYRAFFAARLTGGEMHIWEH